MRIKIIAISLFLSCCLLAAETFPVPTQPYAPRSYLCFQPALAISINGNLSEMDWIQAARTEEFVDITDGGQPETAFRTQAQLLWDSHGLYIALTMYDPHIWTTMVQDDSDLWRENCVAIFIDPDGDTHEYIMLVFNPANAVLDQFVVRPPRDGNTNLTSWTIRDLEYAVAVEGSLNDPADEDLEWTLELRLPWEALAEITNKPCPPMNGDLWRVNFARVHWEADIREGQYLKVENIPPRYWAWSPQGLADMHYPERWGYLFFTTAKVGGFLSEIKIPAQEQGRHYLRQIYYAQKQYRLDNGRYATRISQLNLKAAQIDGRAINPTLETTSRTFIAMLKIDPGLTLMINDEGRITELRP